MFKKTLLKDILVKKKILLSFFFMLIGPLIVILLINKELISSFTSVFQVSEILLAVFFYSFSLVFPILIIIATAPLISSEINDGTMHLLVSIPISRRKIFFSKYLAVFVYGILLSVITLLVICTIIFFVFSYEDIFIFFLSLFIYSVLMLFFFESISIGISCLFDRPRDALLIPIGINIFIFIVFMVFKPLLLSEYGGPSNYETYQIYHFDLSYHFINALYFFIGLYYSDPNYTLTFLYMFGVVKVIPGNQYVTTNYWYPLASLILIIFLGVVIMLWGFWKYCKRDIPI